MDKAVYVSTYTTDIQAQAFRTIAAFVHETYGAFSNPREQITGDDGILLGIVTATESLIERLTSTNEGE